MTSVPCALCGYDAPGSPCPHCGGRPEEPSLARPLRGTWGGVWEGLVAVPRGLAFLARTRGVKRWMLPPLLVTTTILIVVLWYVFGLINSWIDQALPGDFELSGSWAWLEGLSERWDWLKTAWLGLVAAAEWTANAVWALFTSEPLRLLAWFLLGSLLMWYCFSIAYEALAGPFLDEIQARLEAGWFGADPRSRLERPTDLPAATCARLSVLSLGLVLLLVPIARWALGLHWGLVLLLVPLGFLPAALVDRRYPIWLAWVARVEWRATWASLQASVVTGILLVLALPLYFVPGAGYFLFAAVCGFATAVGLLDIPLERRGWPLRMRLRFIGRNLPAMLAFGIVSGFLLAVPILGPVLMVPAASVGGLWLICRLDKRALRAATSGQEGPAASRND